MASALPQDHVKALDQLRTRLSQLSTSMALLTDHLARQDPLPTWPTLQADASTLGTNLADLSDVLNSQRQLFTSMHAYPLPNFPAVTQDVMLQGLLRKKLDPAAEDWIDSSMRFRKDVAIDGGSNDKTEKPTLSEGDVQELWGWARSASANILSSLVDNDSFMDDYTLAERELGVEDIVTGIKRLDEDEDEDEDADKMQVDKPIKKDTELSVIQGMDPSQRPMLLEDILKFTSGTTGLRGS